MVWGHMTDVPAGSWLHPWQRTVTKLVVLLLSAAQSLAFMIFAPAQPNWQTVTVGSWSMEDQKAAAQGDFDFRHLMGDSPKKLELEASTQPPTHERTTMPALVGHPFNWTINEPNLCNSRRPDLFVITFVHTAPQNYKRTILIRETWGSPRLYDKIKIVVLFAMGLPRTTALQTAVKYESNLYRDIIQEDYIDDYRNLTFKGQMWLKWAAFYCPQASFILKTDDDISINIFNLAGHLNQLYKRAIAQHKTILCLVWNNKPVRRDKKSKWFVSTDDYTEEHFSQYCSGSAYILTNDLAPLMYAEALKTRFFWIDDFYITGLLPRAVNVKYHDIRSLYVIFKPAAVAEQNEKLIDGYAIFGHVGSIRRRYYLWEQIVGMRGYKPWRTSIQNDWARKID